MKWLVLILLLAAQCYFVSSCIYCCTLWSFSGPRLHQKSLTQICPSDVAGGGGGHEGLLAARQSVWASIWGVVSARPLLARTHPCAPELPREDRRRRISLHGLGTLWGSLAGLCPAIQRLPVCIPDCLGGTAEFLWLPFKLRKRVCIFWPSWTTGRPWVACQHCGVPVMSCACEAALGNASRDQAGWLKGTFRGENSRIPRSEKGSAPPTMLRSTTLLRVPGRRRGWTAALSLFVLFPASTRVHFAASAGLGLASLII